MGAVRDDRPSILNASAELTAAKPADATRKLTDFRTKVQALGTAGKLGAEDAARLDAGAAAAISYIESASAAPA